MRVQIQRFGAGMDVKTTGIEFAVADIDGHHRGHFYVTKTGLIWCEGRITQRNGVPIAWDDFITWMNNRAP